MRRYRFLVIVLVALVGVGGVVFHWRESPDDGVPEDSPVEEMPETLLASVASRAFAERISVELTSHPVIPGPGGSEIRYTLDNSEPTAESLLYTEPIEVD